MANKKFTSVVHKHFVVTGPFLENVNNGGSVAVPLGYHDFEGLFGKRAEDKGKYIEYVSSKDEKGRDRARRFKFDASLRRLMTREYDRDIYGKSLYEFLKNHPACEGSPYGTYVKDDNGNDVQTGIMFRELDSEADARVALQADTLRINAQADALNLDKETMTEIANILGFYNQPPDITKLRVVEWAGKRPDEYFQLIKAGDRSLRAAVRKALADGVFKQKGELVMWGETIVGSNEDAAIAQLAGDKEMLSALQEKLGLKKAKKATK